MADIVKRIAEPVAEFVKEVKEDWEKYQKFNKGLIQAEKEMNDYRANKQRGLNRAYRLEGQVSERVNNIYERKAAYADRDVTSELPDILGQSISVVNNSRVKEGTKATAFGYLESHADGLADGTLISVDNKGNYSIIETDDMSYDYREQVNKFKTEYNNAKRRFELAEQFQEDAKEGGETAKGANPEAANSLLDLWYNTLDLGRTAAMPYLRPIKALTDKDWTREQLYTIEQTAQQYVKSLELGLYQKGLFQFAQDKTSTNQYIKDYAEDPEAAMARLRKDEMPDDLKKYTAYKMVTQNESGTGDYVLKGVVNSMMALGEDMDWLANPVKATVQYLDYKGDEKLWSNKGAEKLFQDKQFNDVLESCFRATYENEGRTAYNYNTGYIAFDFVMEMISDPENIISLGAAGAAKKAASEVTGKMAVELGEELTDTTTSAISAVFKRAAREGLDDSEVIARIIKTLPDTSQAGAFKILSEALDTSKAWKITKSLDQAKFAIDSVDKIMLWGSGLPLGGKVVKEIVGGLVDALGIQKVITAHIVGDAVSETLGRNGKSELTVSCMNEFFDRVKKNTLAACIADMLPKYDKIIDEQFSLDLIKEVYHSDLKTVYKDTAEYFKNAHIQVPDIRSTSVYTHNKKVLDNQLRTVLETQGLTGTDLYHVITSRGYNEFSFAKPSPNKAYMDAAVSVMADAGEIDITGAVDKIEEGVFKKSYKQQAKVYTAKLNEQTIADAYLANKGIRSITEASLNGDYGALGVAASDSMSGTAQVVRQVLTSDIGSQNYMTIKAVVDDLHVSAETKTMLTDVLFNKSMKSRAHRIFAAGQDFNDDYIYKVSRSYVREMEEECTSLQAWYSGLEKQFADKMNTYDTEANVKAIMEKYKEGDLVKYGEYDTVVPYSTLVSNDGQVIHVTVYTTDGIKTVTTARELDEVLMKDMTHHTPDTKTVLLGCNNHSQGFDTDNALRRWLMHQDCKCKTWFQDTEDLGAIARKNNGDMDLFDDATTDALEVAIYNCIKNWKEQSYLLDTTGLVTRCSFTPPSRETVENWQIILEDMTANTETEKQLRDVLTASVDEIVERQQTAHELLSSNAGLFRMYDNSGAGLWSASNADLGLKLVYDYKTISRYFDIDDLPMCDAMKYMDKAQHINTLRSMQWNEGLLYEMREDIEQLYRQVSERIDFRFNAKTTHDKCAVLQYLYSTDPKVIYRAQYESIKGPMWYTKEFKEFLRQNDIDWKIYKRDLMDNATDWDVFHEELKNIKAWSKDFWDTNKPTIENAKRVRENIVKLKPEFEKFKEIYHDLYLRHAESVHWYKKHAKELGWEVDSEGVKHRVWYKTHVQDGIEYVEEVEIPKKIRKGYAAYVLDKHNAAIDNGFFSTSVAEGFMPENLMDKYYRQLCKQYIGSIEYNAELSEYLDSIYKQGALLKESAPQITVRPWENLKPVIPNNKFEGTKFFNGRINVVNKNAFIEVLENQDQWLNKPFLIQTGVEVKPGEWEHINELIPGSIDNPYSSYNQLNQLAKDIDSLDKTFDTIDELDKFKRANNLTRECDTWNTKVKNNLMQVYRDLADEIRETAEAEYVYGLSDALADASTDAQRYIANAFSKRGMDEINKDMVHWYMDKAHYAAAYMSKLDDAQWENFLTYHNHGRMVISKEVLTDADMAQLAARPKTVISETDRHVLITYNGTINYKKLEDICPVAEDWYECNSKLPNKVTESMMVLADYNDASFKIGMPLPNDIGMYNYINNKFFPGVDFGDFHKTSDYCCSYYGNVIDILGEGSYASGNVYANVFNSFARTLNNLEVNQQYLDCIFDGRTLRNFCGKSDVDQVIKSLDAQDKIVVVRTEEGLLTGTIDYSKYLDNEIVVCDRLEFKVLKDKIRDAKVDSKAMAVVKKIREIESPWISGFLFSNPATWIHNWVDSTTKAVLSEGCEHFRWMVEAANTQKEYVNVINQVAESFKVKPSEVTAEMVDRFFDKHTASLSRERVKDLFDYYSSSIAEPLFREETKDFVQMVPWLKQNAGMFSKCEDTNRLAIYLKHKAEGDSISEAYNAIKMSQFDYAKNNKLRVIDTLMPFSTFKLYNYRFWLSDVWDKPGAYSTIKSLTRLYNYDNETDRYSDYWSEEAMQYRAYIASLDFERNGWKNNYEYNKFEDFLGSPIATAKSNGWVKIANKMYLKLGLSMVEGWGALSFITDAGSSVFAPATELPKLFEALSKQEDFYKDPSQYMSDYGYTVANMIPFIGTLYYMAESAIRNRNMYDRLNKNGVLTWLPCVLPGMFAPGDYKEYQQKILPNARQLAVGVDWDNLTKAQRSEYMYVKGLSYTPSWLTKDPAAYINHWGRLQQMTGFDNDQMRDFMDLAGGFWFTKNNDGSYQLHNYQLMIGDQDMYNTLYERLTGLYRWSDEAARRLLDTAAIPMWKNKQYKGGNHRANYSNAYRTGYGRFGNAYIPAGKGKYAVHPKPRMLSDNLGAGKSVKLSSFALSRQQNNTPMRMPKAQRNEYRWHRRTRDIYKNNYARYGASRMAMGQNLQNYSNRSITEMRRTNQSLRYNDIHRHTSW